MELRNCPVCGKLFVYTVRDMCPDCAKKDEENYEKVRTYLYDVPDATLEKIANHTGVPEKSILEYLKEGRLILKKSNINILLKCEMCGSPIATGRLCEKCAKEFKRGILELKRPIPTKIDMIGKLHLSKFSKDEKTR